MFCIGLILKVLICYTVILRGILLLYIGIAHPPNVNYMLIGRDGIERVLDIVLTLRLIRSEQIELVMVFGIIGCVCTLEVRINLRYMVIASSIHPPRQIAAAQNNSLDRVEMTHRRGLHDNRGGKYGLSGSMCNNWYIVLLNSTSFVRDTMGYSSAHSSKGC